MSSGAARIQWRFRLITCCLVLTTLTFIQAPGRIVADTKLDLALNPGGFLERALNLWDPQGSFGQVQNQAYGYFFPMGPFFWLGDVAGLQPWVVQRLWWALLLSVAFLGMVKLVREFGVTVPWVRILAGFAFALSPRILSVIGPSSIEVWPSALAPWVLLPLVIGTKRGNPVRMAALSAVAVMVVGGVNAAATFAVLPLGVLWLLMAEPGPRRRRLMLWWPAFVLLGTLWWLIPLFLLGSYSPPFLDFIESASNTTVAATAFDALRGVTNWVPYVSSDAVAGKDFVSQPILIINTAVVIALGLVGLARRTTPHRRFLLLGLMLGILLVTAGHTGAMSGWGSLSVQSALDGALAPLRNTHKFDVVIRIPLVIGFAALLSGLVERAGEDKRDDEAIRTVGITVLAIAAVVGATSPAWAGHLANRGSFEGTPRYWSQASSWLDDNADGTSLLVPASAFPNYLWGSTGDEPVQALTETKWAVRNSIPLANPGTIRQLDALTNQLAQGSGSTGLATTLRRSGVEYLVVRNDLDGNRLVANAESVLQTLTRSEGITPVKSFGPLVGADPEGLGGDLRSFVDGGWHARHRAIEVFKVADPGSTRIQDFAATPTVIGSAASLVTLDKLGITDDRSVILAADQPDGTEPSALVLTDDGRRQEAAFGSVYDNRSSSLAPNDKYATRRPIHDYVADGDERWMAVPALEGAKSLTASSTRAAATTLGGARPAEQPFAAFDRNDRTSWTADGRKGWIRLGLGSARDIGRLTLLADLAPGVSQRVTVATAGGPRRVTLTGRTPATIEVGSVKTLEIRGEAQAGEKFSIAEAGADLDLARPLALPPLRTGWGAPEVIVLGMDDSERPGCIRVESIDRCRADRGSWGEDGALIDRKLELPDGASYGVGIALIPLGGTALDALLQEGLDGKVAASSVVNDDPRAGVTRVIDRDTKSGWIARHGDTDPTVDFAWDSPRTIDQINLATASSLPASAPTSAVLDFGDGSQTTVDLVDGVANFPAVETSRVSVHLRTAEPIYDYDSAGLNKALPIGVSELWFRGGRLAVQVDDDEVTIPCGDGPQLVVNNRAISTTVSTTTEDLANGKPARAMICDESSLALPSGTSHVSLRASSMFRLSSLVLQQDGGLPAGTSSAVKRTGESTVEGSLELPGGSTRLVGTGENFNRGWKADAGKKALTPVQVNGWQQAWIVPGGTEGKVALSFGPNRAYQGGLVVGAVAALFLLVIAFRRWPDFTSPSRTRKLPYGRAIAAALIAAIIGLVGGFALLGIAGLGAAVCVAVRKVFDEREWLLTLPLAAAAGAYTLNPWGGQGDWAGNDRFAQICVGLALGILAAVVLSDRQDFNLRNGSSTTR